MDPKFSFTILLFFFLSWSLQGFSQDSEATNDLTSSLDNLGEGLAGYVLGAATQGAGGADGMSCIKKLLPCQPYMHSSSPPESCCKPLEEIVLSDSQCLCKAFKDPETLKTFDLTLDQALAVPYACGIDVDMTVCGTLPTTPSASPKESKSKALTPTSAPATPSDSGSSTGKSSESSNSPSESISSSTSSSSNSGNPSSNPPTASKSSAAVTDTHAFSYKFVTVCVLMVAAFHL